MCIQLDWLSPSWLSAYSELASEFPGLPLGILDESKCLNPWHFPSSVGLTQLVPSPVFFMVPQTRMNAWRMWGSARMDSASMYLAGTTVSVIWENPTKNQLACWV